MVKLSGLGGGSHAEVSYVDYVCCNIGRDYAVDSYIYERGYDFATFALKANGPSMTASGYWAPDTFANNDYTQAAP